MANDASFGPIGLVAEIVIVSLGALGVAAMFQDYAYFHKPEAITFGNVVLKYCAVVIFSIVNTLLIRQRRKAAKAAK